MNANTMTTLSFWLSVLSVILSFIGILLTGSVKKAITKTEASVKTQSAKRELQTRLSRISNTDATSDNIAELLSIGDYIYKSESLSDSPIIHKACNELRILGFRGEPDILRLRYIRAYSAIESYLDN